MTTSFFWPATERHKRRADGGLVVTERRFHQGSFFITGRALPANPTMFVGQGKVLVCLVSCVITLDRIRAGWVDDASSTAVIRNRSIGRCAVIGAIVHELINCVVDIFEQMLERAGIACVLTDEFMCDDFAAGRADRQMQFVPLAPRFGTMLFLNLSAHEINLKPGTVDNKIQVLQAAADLPIRFVAVFRFLFAGPEAQGGMIGNGKVQIHHSRERRDKSLDRAQGQSKDERGLDSQPGTAPLTNPICVFRSMSGSQSFGCQPKCRASAPTKACLIFLPVLDLEFHRARMTTTAVIVLERRAGQSPDIDHSF